MLEAGFMQTAPEVDPRAVLSNVRSLWLKQMASGHSGEKCR